MALLSALTSRHQRSPVRHVINLETLDAVMDTSEHTYDAVISDLYVRAAKALQAGDLETAESLYRTVISKYPNDPDGHESLGACLSMQGRNDDAEAEYKIALSLSPTSEDAAYGLGCIAFDRERYAEAQAYLEKALTANDNSGLSHRLLGIIHEQMGDRERAIRHYERTIELASTVGDADKIKVWLARLKNEDK
ncbi:MAG: tetratricopeptide repeat protein [Planctomycetaceae bacterium]|nr:tetratricopeptide repeat protein [Planctomycetaceae bacterium]